MSEEIQWTHEDLKVVIERGSIADLEKLIANPERKYRQEFANSYAIRVLTNLVESEVLPEDIRILVQRVIELHEKASDPFLGMNLAVTPDPDTEQEAQG